MKKGEGRYYKIARPDGWDFYTGKTINYRAALGTTVHVPNLTGARPALCTPSVIHASRRAEDCFAGGRVPCSLYRVQGTPLVHDNTKAGFEALSILEEIDPATFFKWRYAEACNPPNPLAMPIIDVTPDDIALLHQWDSVRDGVRDSVGPSVRGSVGDSVCPSVGPSVWDSVCASVWGSVRAYIGYIFAPVVPTWQQYPYQSCVELWKRGLVPSYDGTTWRLHSGAAAQVVYEEDLVNRNQKNLM